MRKFILKETQEPEVSESGVQGAASKELPGPGGIGMAVAIDWGLAVQILLTPFVSIFGGPSKMMKIPALNPFLGNVLFFVLAFLAAGLLVYFGEMIRSGRKWARPIQLVFSALLSLAGIFSLVNLYQSISVGNFWPVVTELILVIFSPLIVWRLSRPSTARWFKEITATDARKRHGGKWVWFIALWAIIGGVLQTIAAMK